MRIRLTGILFFLVIFMAGMPVNAAEEEKPKLVKVTIEDTGVRIKHSSAFFAAPYVVEPGDTFETISQKVYATPGFAELLSKYNGIPIDAKLAPDSGIYIVVTDFALKFKPAEKQEQVRKIKSFLKAAGAETLFKYTWANIVVDMSIEDEKITYTKFNPKNFKLTSPDNEKLQMIFSFTQQPLLMILNGDAEIETIEVTGLKKK